MKLVKIKEKEYLISLKELNLYSLKKAKSCAYKNFRFEYNYKIMNSEDYRNSKEFFINRCLGRYNYLDSIVMSNKNINVKKINRLLDLNIINDISQEINSNKILLTFRSSLNDKVFAKIYLEFEDIDDDFKSINDYYKYVLYISRYRIKGRLQNVFQLF